MWTVQTGLVTAVIGIGATIGLAASGNLEVPVLIVLLGAICLALAATYAVTRRR